MQIDRIVPTISSFALPLALAVVPTWSSAQTTWDETAPASATVLSEARSWSYQLQNIRPDRFATTNFDVLVIDHSSDGTAQGIFGPDVIERLKHKPDGSRRIVLAYLSIGEAEDYRFYWNELWTSNAPDWLMPENPEWPGNYPVRYWDGDWQQIMYTGPESYLGLILKAGFDGVYLDRIDAFDLDDWGVPRTERKHRMAEFVAALARSARARSPGFLIVAQNGEELLTDPIYLATIDALGKEDLFFGLDGDGIRNRRSDIRASLDLISNLTNAGKPVFLVEYLSRREDIITTRIEANALGMPLFVGSRPLDQMLSR